MLSVVISIAMIVQFVICPVLFYASARLFKTKASGRRVLLTWLALFAANLLFLFASIAIKANALLLLLCIGAIVLSIGLTVRLLRVGIWRGLGVFVAYVVAGVAFVLGVRAVVVEAFLVPGASMAPTILAGDRVLVDKLTPRFVPLQRGDVVAFEYWEGFPDTRTGAALIATPFKQTYLKRIVGLPGDVVEVREDEVCVNGESVGPDLAARHGRPGDEPFQGRIPEGTMYLVGDNKEASKDSRILGFMPISSIKGKAVVIYASVVPTGFLSSWARSSPTAPDGAPPDWHDPDDPPGRIRWERIGRVIR